MKPDPIDTSFSSIEHHIRRAQVQRVVFLADILTRAILATSRALVGTTTRLAGAATRAAPRRVQLAPR
jgi:hypothetical protein